MLAQERIPNSAVQRGRQEPQRPSSSPLEVSRVPLPRDMTIYTFPYLAEEFNLANIPTAWMPKTIHALPHNVPL